MDTICICKPTSNSHNGVGIFRSKRKQPPASYLFTIQSYSLLKNQKYFSSDFQIGGHTWKLVLHPGDNSQRNNNGHVSLHLQIQSANKNNGWKVNVHFKLFVHDQIRNEYLTIQDAGEAVRTFSRNNTEYGFKELISLMELKDKSKGYLDNNDKCVFGAEVYVYDDGHPAKSELLTMVKNPTPDSFKCKIHKFSTLDVKKAYQSIRHFAGRDWVLSIYPKGTSGAGKFLSIYLEMKNGAPDRTVYATYTIKILDQLNNTHHHQKNASAWFHPSSGIVIDALNRVKDMAKGVVNFLGSPGNAIGIGFSEFISLKELNNPKFIQGDAISMEVEIQVSMISSYIKT